jgi:hypothetical protein
MGIAYFIDEKQYDPENPNHRSGKENVGRDNEFTWYVEIRHVGCVVKESEKNGRDDSDFFATFWDEESQSWKTEMFGTTRGWCYPVMGLTTVDATPEIRERYNAMQALMAKRNAAVRRVRQAQVNKHTVRKGDEVVVCGGRKVPVGKRGVVFWVGQDKFRGMSRIGFKAKNGSKFFTALSNCMKVLDGKELTPVNDAFITERYDTAFSRSYRIDQAIGWSFEYEAEIREKVVA